MSRLLLVFSWLLSTYCLAQDKVIIAYGHNYKPYAWVEDGVLMGIHIDILNELFIKRLGYDIEHQRFPWKRAQWQLQSGKADAILTAYTQSRAQYSIASNEAIITLQYKLYTYKQHPQLQTIKALTSLKQLQGYSAVEYLGSTTEDLEANGVKIHLVPEIESALKFLANKRADIFFDNPYVTNHLIRQLGLQHQIIEMPHTVHETRHHLLIGKQSSLLQQLAKIDAAILAMKTDGTITKILQAYQ